MCISTYISYSGHITIIQLVAQELAAESNGCGDSMPRHELSRRCHVSRGRTMVTLCSGCHELSHRSVRHNVTKVCVTCRV